MLRNFFIYFIVLIPSVMVNVCVCAGTEQKARVRKEEEVSVLVAQSQLIHSGQEKVKRMDISLLKGRFTLKNVKQSYQPSQGTVTLQAEATKGLKMLVRVLKRKTPLLSKAIRFDGHTYCLTFLAPPEEPFIKEIVKFESKDNLLVATVR